MNELYPKTALITTQFVIWLRSDDAVDFWQELYRNHQSDIVQLNDIATSYIYKYAELMQTSLSLEMFVPCKDEKILEYPEIDKVPSVVCNGCTTPTRALIDYQHAKEKVLFEGYQWDETFKSARRWIDGKLHSEHFTDGNGNIIVKNIDTTCYLKLPANIEDLVRQIELIPIDNFWQKIF